MRAWGGWLSIHSVGDERALACPPMPSLPPLSLFYSPRPFVLFYSLNDVSPSVHPQVLMSRNVM